MARGARRATCKICTQKPTANGGPCFVLAPQLPFSYPQFIPVKQNEKQKRTGSGDVISLSGN
jgi:hypothetical protein